MAPVHIVVDPEARPKNIGIVAQRQSVRRRHALLTKMARKLILAADVVRALQELAAGLLPHDDGPVRPAHRERRVALAVAELADLRNVVGRVERAALSQERRDRTGVEREADVGRVVEDGGGEAAEAACAEQTHLRRPRS